MKSRPSKQSIIAIVAIAIGLVLMVVIEAQPAEQSGLFNKYGNPPSTSTNSTGTGLFNKYGSPSNNNDASSNALQKLIEQQTNTPPSSTIFQSPGSYQDRDLSFGSTIRNFNGRTQICRTTCIGQTCTESCF